MVRALLLIPLIGTVSLTDPFTMPNGARRELAAPPGHVFSLRNADFTATLTFVGGEPIINTSTSTKAGTLPIKITREACVDLQVRVIDSSGNAVKAPECSPTLSYLRYVVHLVDPGKPYLEGGSLTKKFNYRLPPGDYTIVVTRRTLVAEDEGSISSPPAAFTIP